jgi:trigger factor
MPTFQREAISDLHFKLTATLAPSDYEAEYNTQLEKYRKEAAIKGFRKGKTPVSVVRKMFGKSVLADILNKKLQEAIPAYSRENDLDMLGGPIPSDENDTIALDSKELKEYSFIFEVGVAPSFDIQGTGPEAEYERLDVIVSENRINEHLEGLRKENSRKVRVDDNVNEDGEVRLNATELEGEAPRENGISTSFSVGIQQIKDEALRAQVLAAKTGDTLQIPNIFEAFHMPADRVLQELLQSHEEDTSKINPAFAAVVEELFSEEPAPLDEEFFAFAFGDDIAVSNEEDAKNLIKKDLEDYFAGSAQSLLRAQIRERITELNEFALPEGFPKKWLLYSNEELTEEEVEAQFDAIAKTFRWNVLKGRLAKQHEVNVSEQELQNYFMNKVRQMLGGYAGLGESFLQSMAQRLMEREESVMEAYDEIYVTKLLAAVAGQVSLVSKPVTEEELQQAVQAFNAKYKPLTEQEEDADLVEAEDVQPESEADAGE